MDLKEKGGGVSWEAWWALSHFQCYSNKTPTEPSLFSFGYRVLGLQHAFSSMVMAALARLKNVLVWRVLCAREYWRLRQPREQCAEGGAAILDEKPSGLRRHSRGRWRLHPPLLLILRSILHAFQARCEARRHDPVAQATPGYSERRRGTMVARL